MRITRYINARGEPWLGRDLGDGWAERLEGDLWSGLRPGGEIEAIGQRLAPLQPLNIFCIGLNYRVHAEETGMELPRHPVLFMKPTSTLIGPGEPILLPACCEQGPEVDYEAELAVVIGKAARNVSEARALDHVFGYACANDVSARRWQMHGGGGQWIRGKSFDSFCPLGPVLVTADEIPDPQALGVCCRINGQPVQDGSTSDMIFGVARLIHLLSRDMTLLSGSVILTGTPSGVGFSRTPPRYLTEGDVVTVEVESIGELSNPVRRAG
ncbi:MAG: fumarylacetoacetate hydrolase family protein [Candidatus Sedimenticola endophacoides]